MGKRSGITKGGRMMNPADRERKQQRVKELKRNKKQRTAVRQAIVKGRDPDQIIESLTRLDDQEFDAERQLSLNVIQEKRNKLRGSFYQVINLYRQEKNENKIKQLERMMFEYEVERARKEENFRAQVFSENADFEEIPLPIGSSAPEAANTPFTPSGSIGPQMPAQLQLAMKAGILKKPTGIIAKKRHKYPPGPPPGVAPVIFEDDEEDADQEGMEEGRHRRVRFGDEPRRRNNKEKDKERGQEENDDEEEDEEEDYAPVEIPEGLLEPVQPPQQQPVYSRPVPSLAAPAVGSGPIMPQMAPPPPAYPPGYPMSAPPGHSMAHRMAQPAVPPPKQSKTGLVTGNYPPDPHPSAIISAEPQVVKPNVIVPTETVISAAPQMRNITRESTRFVPTAVKIQRPVVPVAPSIGPKIPSNSSVAGPTKLVPKSALKAKTRPNDATQPGKSVDQACDDFLKELEGLL